MVIEGKNEFQLYRRIAQKYSNQLPDIKDRVRALKWIKKISEPVEKCQEKTQLKAIQLLIISLSRKVLVEPFTEKADKPLTCYEWSTMQPADIGRLVCNKEAELMGKPPIFFDVSGDLCEYFAHQMIPNFGSHFFYANSPERIQNWDKLKMSVVPKGLLCLKVISSPNLSLLQKAIEEDLKLKKIKEDRRRRILTRQEQKPREFVDVSIVEKSGHVKDQFLTEQPCAKNVLNIETFDNAFHTGILDRDEVLPDDDMLPYEGEKLQKTHLERVSMAKGDRSRDSTKSKKSTSHNRQVLDRDAILKARENMLQKLPPRLRLRLTTKFVPKKTDLDRTPEIFRARHPMTHDPRNQLVKQWMPAECGVDDNEQFNDAWQFFDQFSKSEGKRDRTQRESDFGSDVGGSLDRSMFRLRKQREEEGRQNEDGSCGVDEDKARRDSLRSRLQCLKNRTGACANGRTVDPVSEDAQFGTFLGDIPINEDYNIPNKVLEASGDRMFCGPKVANFVPDMQQCDYLPYVKYEPVELESSCNICPGQPPPPQLPKITIDAPCGSDLMDVSFQFLDSSAEDGKCPKKPDGMNVSINMSQSRSEKPPCPPPCKSPRGSPNRSQAQSSNAYTANYNQGQACAQKEQAYISRDSDIAYVEPYQSPPPGKMRQSEEGFKWCGPVCPAPNRRAQQPPCRPRRKKQRLDPRLRKALGGLNIDDECPMFNDDQCNKPQFPPEFTDGPDLCNESLPILPINMSVEERQPSPCRSPVRAKPRFPAPPSPCGNSFDFALGQEITNNSFVMSPGSVAAADHAALLAARAVEVRKKFQRKLGMPTSPCRSEAQDPCEDEEPCEEDESDSGTIGPSGRIPGVVSRLFPSLSASKIAPKPSQTQEEECPCEGQDDSERRKKKKKKKKKDPCEEESVCQLPSQSVSKISQLAAPKRTVDLPPERRKRLQRKENVYGSAASLRDKQASKPMAPSCQKPATPPCQAPESTPCQKPPTAISRLAAPKHQVDLPPDRKKRLKRKENVYGAAGSLRNTKKAVPLPKILGPKPKIELKITKTESKIMDKSTETKRVTRKATVYGASTGANISMAKSKDSCQGSKSNISKAWKTKGGQKSSEPYMQELWSKKSEEKQNACKQECRSPTPPPPCRKPVAKKLSKITVKISMSDTSKAAPKAPKCPAKPKCPPKCPTVAPKTSGTCPRPTPKKAACKVPSKTSCKSIGKPTGKTPCKTPASQNEDRWQKKAVKRPNMSCAQSQPSCQPPPTQACQRPPSPPVCQQPQQGCQRPQPKKTPGKSASKCAANEDRWAKKPVRRPERPQECAQACSQPPPSQVCQKPQSACPRPPAQPACPRPAPQPVACPRPQPQPVCPRPTPQPVCQRPPPQPVCQRPPQPQKCPQPMASASTQRRPMSTQQMSCTAPPTKNSCPQKPSQKTLAELRTQYMLPSTQSQYNTPPRPAIGRVGNYDQMMQLAQQMAPPRRPRTENIDDNFHISPPRDNFDFNPLVRDDCAFARPNDRNRPQW